MPLPQQTHMKFSIAVYSSPEDGSTARSALQFTQELLNQGHELYRLFFFNNGVMNCAASQNICTHDWQTIIETHNLEAIVCMTSAQKRGLRQADKNEGQLNETSIHPTFRPGGIAQLIDATVQSDRVVSFGG